MSLLPFSLDLDPLGLNLSNDAASQISVKTAYANAFTSQCSFGCSLIPNAVVPNILCKLYIMLKIYKYDQTGESFKAGQNGGTASFV